MQTYACPSGDVVMLDDDIVLPGRLSVGSHGYAQLTGVDPGSVVLLHRWLMGCSKGDGVQVDHRNRNKLDCQRANLRRTDAAGNSQNTPRRCGNVYPTRGGKWQARAKLRGRAHYLGTFTDRAEALRVAAEWRREHFPLAVD